MGKNEEEGWREKIKDEWEVKEKEASRVRNVR